MTLPRTTAEATVRSSAEAPELVEPGRGGGLVGVLRRRYLLRLLVRKELRVRYQGSVLGMAWSYIKPAVQFGVYFFVVGLFLGLRDRIEDFPVYLFSGMVLIHFFIENFNSATRSIVQNRSLIRKVYLPREMFPVASLLVSCVHFLPQLVILLLGALAAGWTPSPVGLGASVLGFFIVATLGMAVGLLFAAFNVFYRDFEKIVDVLGIVITWSAPMIYPWTAVRDVFGDGWLLQTYLANPLVTAVSLFQHAFWLPGTSGGFEFPPHLFVRGLISLGAILLLVGVAQFLFSRLNSRFAQEM
ncbi:MAG: ABC transporter permease [Streptosporangiales bacterium]|nr:ABC transporter permease [Streptosporangiales bacterium]